MFFLCPSALTDAVLEAAVWFCPGLSRKGASAQLLRDRCPAPYLAPRQPILAPCVDNGSMIAVSFEETSQFFLVVMEVLKTTPLHLQG